MSDRLPHPLCFFRMIWRSFWCMLKTGCSINGCDLVQTCDPFPAEITELKCTVCGGYRHMWTPLAPREMKEADHE